MLLKLSLKVCFFHQSQRAELTHKDLARTMNNATEAHGKEDEFISIPPYVNMPLCVYGNLWKLNLIKLSLK